MPSTNPQGDVGTQSVDVAQKIIEVLGLLFSTVFLSGINIAISGHLLGYVLGLKSDGTNRFTLRIPFMFSIEVKGAYVIAGFAAYSLSLAFVGFVLSDTAKRVFITNLNATGSQWSACQGLAAIISVFVCLICASIRLTAETIQAKKAQARVEISGGSEQQRVRNLIRDA